MDDRHHSPDSDPHDLDRFLAAQQAHGTYHRAVAELRRGRKQTHWMWFVFPQVTGLGVSATSRRYAISGLAEARAYLAHPVLGPRLRDCSGLVAEHHDRSAVEIFGGVDAQKLRSCMTLFARAVGEESVFSRVLDASFDGRADAATLERL